MTVIYGTQCTVFIQTIFFFVKERKKTKRKAHTWLENLSDFVAQGKNLQAS